MKTERSAGVVIFYYNQDAHRPEYLILHYPGGHWDFAKGKMESGENLEQTATREVQEETGLDITMFPAFAQDLTYYFRSKGGELVHKTVTFFVGQADEKQVTLSHEHQDYTWLEIEKSVKQLTFHNAQELLRMAHNFVEDKIFG
jgi:8-oxo-dGTP pyrophosphatase MutT (NUDIX family)